MLGGILKPAPIIGSTLGAAVACVFSKSIGITFVMGMFIGGIFIVDGFLLALIISGIIKEILSFESNTYEGGL